MNDQEASFLRRPAHTEAEDWVVYHPLITPTALMLYMRLRGAVMDPSSNASDWQKSSRFTIEQMRRLLPRAKADLGKRQKESEDPYVSDRTVQRNLLLLLQIGALRRINVARSQVPVYDFPMNPPEGHTGPTWGGFVGRAIRLGEEKDPQSSVVTVGDQEGCHLCRGVTPVSGEGDMRVTGGCHRCHRSEAVTRKNGALKKPFKKNPLPPQETEDEEEKTSPPAGRPAAERHPDTDMAIKGFAWPRGFAPRGHDLKQVREVTSVLLTRGWTPERLKTHMTAKVRWKKAVSPVAVVLHVLKNERDHPSDGRTLDEEAIEILEAEISAQKAAVAACAMCDDVGWTTDGWHGHGRKGLTNEMWNLRNPDQAQLNESMNATDHRIA